MTDTRNHAIDFVKGICIIFVLITHYAWSSTERLRYLFPFWIEMAVPLFMIISGFVNSKSYVKHGITNLEKAYDLKNISSKIVRYTVPFAIAFFIEEIVCGVLGMIDITVWQAVSSFLSGGFGPGSYYYPILIQFVFWFPIIFVIVKKYDFKGVLICAFINAAFEVLKSAYAMNEECYRLLLFRYTLLIAFGCYLAIGNSKINKKTSFVMVVAGITYIIVFCYLGFTPPVTNYWTGTCIWACLPIMPISIPLLKSEKLKNSAVEFLGKASYDIFLVQMVYYNGADIVYKVNGR